VDSSEYMKKVEQKPAATATTAAKVPA
jgi:hypothetical protein